MKKVDEETARRVVYLEDQLKNKNFYASLLLWGDKIKVSIKSRITGAIQWIDTDHPELTEQLLKEQ